MIAAFLPRLLFVSFRSHDGNGSARQGTKRDIQESAPPVSIPEADAQMLERIRAGDMTAFNELFHAHWTSLCIAAAVYTHDMDIAEELVATIFSDLWIRRESLVITVKLRTYLHAAVKHRTVNWRRDRARHEELESLVLPDDIPGFSHDIEATLPSIVLEQQDSIAHALEIVNSLPDRYRLAFIYRWRDDWEYVDIAAALGVSVNGAQALVSRALKMIRAHLTD